jgi:hypothetical protein
MEHAQPQTVRRPSPKGMKRAFKIILGLFTGFLILNVAWRTYWEDFVNELLLDMRFRTADVRPRSEEEIQVAQSDFQAFSMRPSASYFDTPAWGFLDGDEIDSACIHDPCKRALIYPEFTQVTCWPSVQVIL